MIYLDNAATTRPCEAALLAFAEEATLAANPSSMHRAGYEAHTRLEEARKVIADTLSADPAEIYFTSGGTENANLALLGAAQALRRRGNKILYSDAEHPCVSETLKALSKEGFSIVKIPTRGGKLDLDRLKEEADASVVLAAFMHVNNETGAIFDTKSAADLIHTNCPHALVFCDCVQSYLKLSVSPRERGADLLSLSAHKIHGLRGVGALYVRRGVRLAPVNFGGGQEAGLRNGTENAPGIAAFAAAAREGFANLSKRGEAVRALRDTLEAGLTALGAEVLTGFDRAAHILSASFPGYKSEVLLHLFSDAGVCVSAGSACSSKKSAKSPVLLAHGLSPERADGTLRFSLSHFTTQEDIQAALSAAEQILSKGRYRK